MPSAPEIRRLGLDDLGRIGEIDRSERVDVEYQLVDGRIVERPVTMADIPPWDPIGTGPYSVAHQQGFCRPIIGRGGVFLGAFDGETVLGLAVVEGAFEPGLAWLAFLYVSRPHRRRGVASGLWRAAEEAARAAGAAALYVSAVPTGSAVGFYLSRGCAPADPVHPELLELEPDDIHLECDLAPRDRPPGGEGIRPA